MNKKFIPLSIPHISGNEWKYVKECFDTNWVSSAGKYVNKFEDDICNKFNAKYAVAVINGTAAIHLSLLALGIGQGDEVIVPTLTFVAPINAVKYTGADPVFMDCEDQFFNINPDKIENFLEEKCKKINGKIVNTKSGKEVKAMIPVHIFGVPCQMDRLNQISKKYNLRIIEDATESIGSKINDLFTGTIGDVGCYSFNGNKIITTGGGGIVVTNNKEIADKIRHLSTQAKSDQLFYDHDEVGFNYRMTNITAAFGVAQLEQLDEYINIKRENASYYKNKFEGLEGIEFRADDPENGFSNNWFYSLLIKKEAGISRNDLMFKLIEKGIECRPVWKLNHTLKPYSKCENYLIKSATKVYEEILNIPCSVSLSKDDINYIVKTIKEIL